MEKSNKILEENAIELQISEVFSFLEFMLSQLRSPIDVSTPISNNIFFFIKQLSNTIRKLADTTNSDIWLVCDLFEFKILLHSDNPAQETINEDHLEFIFNSSHQIKKKLSFHTQNEKRNSINNLQILSKLLENQSKIVLHKVNGISSGDQKMLDWFKADNLFLLKEYFLDHEILVAIGVSKNLNMNNSSEYGTTSVRILENTLGIIAAVLQSYNLSFSYHALKKSPILRDRVAWMKAAEQFIYALVINLQKTNLQEYKSKHRKYQNITLRITLINEKTYDEIISNYLRALLWVYQTKQYDKEYKIFRFEDLISLFPITNCQEKNFDFEYVTESLKGIFGFYLNIEGNSPQWIPIGPNCIKTHHELSVLHEFIFHQIDYYIVSSKNNSNIDTNIQKYKKWKKRFTNYRSCIEKYLKEYFNEQ